MPLHTLEIFLRLFLAFVLGGIIGLERESIKRPAGFRTHILVCVGATIVMITNIELIHLVPVDVQPGRFGAAVISGIGFLGAGTIMKEGFSVKGLTTAASLWTTACIGITLGSGLYSLAFAASFMIFLALEVFPRISRILSKQSAFKELTIITEDKILPISKITSVLDENNIEITSITTEYDSKLPHAIILKLTIKNSAHVKNNLFISELSQIHELEKIELN